MGKEDCYALSSYSTEVGSQKTTTWTFRVPLSIFEKTFVGVPGDDVVQNMSSPKFEGPISSP